MWVLLAATRSGAFLAVGTSSGSVFVWDMRYPTPQLIRAAKAIPLLDPPRIPAVPDVFLSEPDKQKQATETQNQEPIPAPKALRLLRFLKFKQRATPKVSSQRALLLALRVVFLLWMISLQENDLYPIHASASDCV